MMSFKSNPLNNILIIFIGHLTSRLMKQDNYKKSDLLSPIQESSLENSTVMSSSPTNSRVAVQLNTDKVLEGGSNNHSIYDTISETQSFAKITSKLNSRDIDTIVVVTHTALMVCVLYYLMVQSDEILPNLQKKPIESEN